MSQHPAREAFFEERSQTPPFLPGWGQKPSCQAGVRNQCAKHEAVPGTGGRPGNLQHVNSCQGKWFLQHTNGSAEIPSCALAAATAVSTPEAVAFGVFVLTLSHRNRCSPGHVLVVPLWRVVRFNEEFEIRYVIRRPPACLGTGPATCKREG